MKRILSIIAAVFLTATVMLPINAPVEAQTEQVNLVIPTNALFGSGAPNVISVNTTSPGAIASAEYQTIFNDASGTFVAAEIFAQKSLTIPSPRAGTGVMSDNTSVPAGLPSGSIAFITVFGTVSSVNTTSGEWQIGTPPIFVYESSTTSIQGTPGLGSSVRVEAVRTPLPGPIIADKITQLAGGGLPASPPTMDMMFLFNGTIQSVQTSVQSAGIQLGAETWTADNVTFRIDDANSPARIDPGIGLGAGLDPVVTVLFKTPLDSNVSANVALEIHAEDLAGLDQVLPTLHPDPVANTVAVPIQVPTGSWMQFDIDGVVTSVNTAAGEWQIGTPPVIVYEGATTDNDTGLPISATVFGGARRPVQGDEVRVVATRDLMPGPLVAKQIVLLTGGPLTASVPVIDRFFRFNGSVQTMGADTWAVANVDFVVNDPLSPAVIEAGLAVGDNVTTNFNVIGPPAPESALWASLTLDSATNLHTGVLTPPAVNAERSGFLFLRVTNAQQQVTTTIVPATLLAVPAAVPTIPGNLATSSVSTTRVNLTWTDASDNEVSFRVERATDANFTLNMQSFVVAANSEGFSDITAPINTALFYRVFAVNGAGDSVPSGMASALPPVAPSNLSGNVITQNRIDLRWNHSSADESGFRVERAAGSGGFSVIAASLPVDTVSYSDTDVEAGTTLNYRVFAFNLRGDSAVAGPVQVIIPMPDVSAGGGGGGNVTTTGPSVSLSGLTGGSFGLTSSGATVASAQVGTTDGRMTMSIAAGTTMLTATGSPIASLSAAPASPPAAPPQGAVLINYNFGPDGATFNPPLVINLAYSASDIPAGANEADLSAAFWNGSQWVKLESFVDTSTHIISAKVTHFTNIGVVYAPPVAAAPKPPAVVAPTPIPPEVVAPAPAAPEVVAPAPEATPVPTPALPPAPTPTPAAEPTPATNSIVSIGIAGAAIVLIGLAILYRRKRLPNR